MKSLETPWDHNGECLYCDGLGEHEDDCPVVVILQDLPAARKAFRAKCRAILFEAYQHADNLSSAVGEVSVDEAFDGWLAGVVLLLKKAIAEHHPEIP